jgi:peptidyl-prolyl cis-trans isomerase SurA
MSVATMIRTSSLVLASLTFATPIARAEIVDRIAAVVDREAITLSEAEQVAELRALRGQEELSMEDVVERLIEARLVEREVNRYPEESIPQERIDEMLDSIRESFSSDDTLVDSKGMTLVELEVLVRKQLTVQRYLERRFRPLVYVTEADIEKYYDEELVPVLDDTDEAVPPLGSVEGSIRRILEEKAFNERVDRWIGDLKSRAHVRRYVW